jgi:hypothetical protein
MIRRASGDAGVRARTRAASTSAHALVTRRRALATLARRRAAGFAGVTLSRPRGGKRAESRGDDDGGASSNYNIAVDARERAIETQALERKKYRGFSTRRRICGGACW